MLMMSESGRKTVARGGLLRTTDLGSFADSPLCAFVEPKAACPLPAQLRTFTACHFCQKLPKAAVV